MRATTRRAERIIAGALAALAGGAWGSDLYWGGGAVDLAAGTPLPLTTNALSGTWNLTLNNWATSPAPGAYATYADGAFVQLGYYTNSGPGPVATLTLEASPQVAGFEACLNATTDFNRFFDLTAASARTVTPVGSLCALNLVSQDNTRGMRLRPNVSLAGSAALEKDGAGVFEVQSDSSAYTGEVRVRMGNFSIASSGSLRGVSRFDLSGRIVTATASGYGGNEFGMGALTVTAANNANDKLGDSALVVLNRSNFDYRPTASSTETMGRVDVETWGVLGGSQGTAGGVLTLGDATAGLTRGSSGQAMAMVPVASAGTPFVNIRVPNGLATNVVLPWLASGRGGLMYVDGADSYTLKQAAVTAAATDVSTWTAAYGPESNVRVGDNSAVVLTGALSGDLQLKSLGLFNTGAATLALGGNLLSLSSGGLSYKAGALNAHQTLTNGVLTCGADTLYLHSGDSGAAATLVLAVTITGAVDVVKAGVAGIELAGIQNNTYTGKTVVQSGVLTLNKSGGAVAVPGPLVIRKAGSVGMSKDAQLATSSDVTIEAGGLLTPRLQTFGGLLTLAGGSIYLQNFSVTCSKAGAGLRFNGGYINHSSTAAGTLNLQTDVRYEASATAQARFERFSTGAYNIELDGGNRTFDIDDSSSLPAGVPEMVVDTTIIPGSPAGGALTKTGAGTLQLTGTNTYAGGTTVNGGTLRVSVIRAAAQSNLVAYTANAGQSSSIVVFNAPVAKDMAVGQAITGSTLSANRTVVRVLSDYEILTSGLNVPGVSTNAAVGAVERRGSLGSGPVAVTNAGTLKLDTGIAVTNTVRIFSGGTLAASGASVGPLTVSGGTLAADLAFGAVTVSNAVTLSGANLTVAGALGDEPATVLFATGGVTGTFASWPADVTVSYPDANTVVVRKRRTGTVISVL
jgi:autotransporter-associated beta strand protein